MVVVAAGSIAVQGLNITYEEYAKFPKLFHLDEYHECLKQADGLYCVGTFHVKPSQEPDHIYELMKEYSRDDHNFNRTLIHRGVCVSSRCPSLSHVHNVSERFDRCVAQDSNQRSLQTKLTELIYCRSHAEDDAFNNTNAAIETPHRVFVYAVLGLLALNVIGTIYDKVKGDAANKSKILMSWSILSNWKELVGPYPDGDPRLAAVLPFAIFRVIMMILVMLTHAVLIQSSMYMANPLLLEYSSRQWPMMMLRNGSSLIQILLMLSSFFLAHSLLNCNEITIGIVLKQLGKRIFRIMPVYILVIGFVATWWPLMNDGPLWHYFVGMESQVCRHKFWNHAFFIRKFFTAEPFCLVPTWSLVADMQLYILGCLVILCLQRVRRLALLLLGIGFVLFSILNAILSYINLWRPFMLTSGPENFRTMFTNDPSVYKFYMSPVTSLSAMMAGLFLAYLYYQINKTGVRRYDHKWLFYASILMLIIWPSCGYFLQFYMSREFSAFYMAFERLVTLILSGMLLFSMFNRILKKKIKTHTANIPTKGSPNRMFSWRIWYPLGRSSLSVLMLHWCVNMMFKASTLQPITRNALGMTADTITTTFVTYLLALPVTLLVEIPFTMLYSALTSRQKQD
ncbi:unnamed protein product [Arctia plantaginis]|uniref:Acyltransferase 3 domain-containing protein n=1 Tax=Arctia plantaginis TaxID=874455 RepID=A0A8S1ADP8_ARCPL|nr:unnamed protein product [Arctia plantaginis]CAB3245516.1 unnamed protein product [Arctia plantaginis]